MSTVEIVTPLTRRVLLRKSRTKLEELVAGYSQTLGRKPLYFSRGCAKSVLVDHILQLAAQVPA